MDYKKHYDLLIQSRKQLDRVKNKETYYESHHIIPKSMNGTNIKDNLVLLTPREHFIAHWLLYKIYRNRATASAFYRMCQKGNNNMKRYIPSSCIYEEARLAYVYENKNKTKHTELSKKAIGDGNKKPKPISYGINLSRLMKEGLAEKISKANKGISRNKGRKIPWATGRPKTIIYQMDLEENIIKKWEGTKELGKIFSITSLYKAIKLNKQYKNFLWKQNN